MPAERIDPSLYGLNSRTVIEKGKDGKFTLVIDRKSRIIMKDAPVIEEKVRKIQAKAKNTSVFVRTTAPVCSKTKKHLAEQGIHIIEKPE